MKIALMFTAVLSLVFPVLAQAETVSIDPPAEPVPVTNHALTLRLVPAPTVVAPDQSVAFTLTISNTGSAALTALHASYALPTGFISADQESGEHDLGSLDVGQSTSLVINLTASANAPTGRIPLEVVVSADHLDPNEITAVVDVKAGQVLGAATLVATGTSPIGLVIIGLAVSTAGFVLRQRSTKNSRT